MVVTRFFTEAEIDRKRDEMIKAGKRVNVVTPFTSQQIPKKAVSALLQKKETLIDMIVNLNGGEELDEEDCMMQLDNDLYVKLDADYSLVHVRKYWWSSHQQKLLPHKRGKCAVFYYSNKILKN